MGIIIPNWHPVFVHFTVALVIVSAMVHVAHVMVEKESLLIKTATVANWNLWAGGAFSVITVIAGWFAYNSVAHDTPSHVAMTLHKNWALTTAAVIIAVAIWSYIHSRTAIRLSKGIVFASVLAASLVGVTAWLGGEVVYRYGLGVMSLPKIDTHGHAAGADSHAHDHGTESNMEGAQSPAGESPSEDGHAHSEGAASHEHDDNAQQPQHDSLDGGEVSGTADMTQMQPGQAASGDTHDSLDDGGTAATESSNMAVEQGDAKTTEEKTTETKTSDTKKGDDGHGHSH